MAITAKKSFTLKKKDLATSKVPAVGFKKIVAYHKAVAGDLSINLTDLTMPTEMSAAGYSNPSTADLMAADLTFFRDNLALISSARGYLQPGLSYRITSNTNLIFSDSFGTALEDEIFTIIIDPVAKSGVEFVDGAAIPVTGVLPAGQQDFNIGIPFEVNKYPTTQMGAYQFFIDGVLQSRNVGNATADPGADGNYQELPGTGGLGTIIRVNVIDNDNERDIKAIPVGMMLERPSGSTRAEIERQQGQINKLIEVVSDVSGTPESTFTAAPSEVDLKVFGDRVLEIEGSYAKKDASNVWTAPQAIPGFVDGSAASPDEVGAIFFNGTTRGVAPGITSGAGFNAGTLLLQPGRYMLYGAFGVVPNTNTSITVMALSISTTSLTFASSNTRAHPTNGQYSLRTQFAAFVPGLNNDLNINSIGVPVEISVPTTFYCVGACTFTADTNSGYGSLLAVRR